MKWASEPKHPRPLDYHPKVPSPATIIIPARLGSTRFPEKVLASATGRPLIQHVYESAQKSRRAQCVVIAADDDRVRQACESFHAPCVMTDPAHPNGTSRLAQAATLLNLEPNHIVVNVQGDEPELDAALIDAAIEILERTGADVGTVATPFGPTQDPRDPNIVKCVLRRDSTALYFSRAPIPHHRDAPPRDTPTTDASPPHLRHVGIYTYTTAVLKHYAALPPTPLEHAEKLEQLRALEHGHTIAVAVMPSSHEGIDTKEQYDRFVARWRAKHA